MAHGSGNCRKERTFADEDLASHPNYPKYEHLLSPGWILGRKVDNSDQQYSGFRDNIPYMALLLAFHPLLRRLYELLRPINTNVVPELQKAAGSAQDRGADARLDQRVRFDIGFACLYLLALHGTSAFKVFAILYINFSLAKGLPRSSVPWATWIFNIGILFANELCKGYPYADIARVVLPWTSAPGTSGGGPAKNWGSYLDSYGGLLPRWEILFKITVLRLISFNLDYCWSLDRAGGSPLEVSSVSSRSRSPSCLLMAQRRNSLTRPTCQKEIALTYRQKARITLSATILLTFSTPRFTSLALF